MKGDFCWNFSARLYVFFFFVSVFCSFLINTRLVFVSYFVSFPLRKGHRGLEYQCSFVRSFVPVPFCIFDYLYRDFWFFLDFFVTEVREMSNETIIQLAILVQLAIQKILTFSQLRIWSYFVKKFLMENFTFVKFKFSLISKYFKLITQSIPGYILMTVLAFFCGQLDSFQNGITRSLRKRR